MRKKRQKHGIPIQNDVFSACSTVDIQIQVDVHGGPCAKNAKTMGFLYKTVFLAHAQPWTSMLDVHGGGRAKKYVFNGNQLYSTSFAHRAPWTSMN